jgi:WD40 repeat protein
MLPKISSPSSSRYTVSSINFCDDGASVIVCTLETHKVFVFYPLDTCSDPNRIHRSDCYSIEPWVLKWSKQIRTRMCVWFFFFSFFHTANGQCSAHADLNENFMAVMNLDDGVDLYSVPTMQLIKTYSHGNVNNAIFKVSFVDKSWLVSGGQDGFARLYDWQSGQFLQRLEHSSGMRSVSLCYP